MLYKKVSWLWLGAIVLIGCAFRAASFRNFINPDGGFFFNGPDPYDHLRRITLGVKQFPAVPSFDSYAAYPQGLGQIWSPLYDYLLSIVAILFGGGDTVIQTVGFLSNPLFSIITIIALFLIVRKMFNSDVAALTAAFTSAVFPGHISYTMAAKLDHHVLEPLAILMLVSFVFLVKNGNSAGWRTVVASLTFPLTILMWRGATLFWGILFIYSLIRGGMEYSGGKRQYLYHSIAAYLGGAASVALVCLLNTWGAGGFSYSMVSWFHVTVLTVFAILLALLGTACSRAMLMKRTAILLVLLAFSLLLPPVRSMAYQLLAGFSFIGGSDPWLKSIAEQQHLLYWGVPVFLKTVTLLWFLIPVAVIVAFREWWNSGRDNPMLLAVIIWCAGMLPLFRLRYSVVLAVPVALATAYLFSKLWQLWVAPWHRTALCGSLLLLVSPAAQEYRDVLTFDDPPIVAGSERGRNGLFAWLKRNSPQTSFYDNPVKTPEYSVLGSWGLGSKISYLAGRPAVATAFGWEAHGIYEISGFLATRNPDIAFDIVKRNRARYILLRDEDYPFDFAIAQDGVRKGKLPTGTVDTADQNGSVYQRLKYFDGSAYGSQTSFIPALSNYRLVYESAAQFPAPVMKVSHYKMFEVVPGAVAEGACAPGDDVFLSLTLQTSTGRIFPYAARTRAGATGRFEFRVPYATGVRQGDTLPQGRYSVKCGSIERFSFDIPEKTVIEGGTVSLVLP